MAAKPGLPDDAAGLAAELEERLGAATPQAIVEASIAQFGVKGIGVVSSFGADSAVLLDIVAQVDPETPVLFLDTGQHFGETIGYRDALVADLGLTDLRVFHPRPELAAERDPLKTLHLSDPDACCDIRKVEPMARAVEPLAAWFTGRKRHQSTTRSQLAVFEAVGPRVRINPLAAWSAMEIAGYIQARKLRENPLVTYGYLSIGCFPCTQPAAPGADARSGRWAGRAKTECGIHLAQSGSAAASLGALA